MLKKNRSKKTPELQNLINECESTEKEINSQIAEIMKIVNDMKIKIDKSEKEYDEEISTSSGS